MEGLFGVGLLVGSLVGPALVALLGIRPSLAVAGAILPILALITWRPIAKRTRRSPLVEAQTALLRRNPLFAPLPLTALDAWPGASCRSRTGRARSSCGKVIQETRTC